MTQKKTDLCEKQFSMSTTTLHTAFECKTSVFKLEKLIASGGFGDVHQCFVNNSLCVRKTLHNKNEFSQNDFNNECFYLETLCHPNIVDVVTVLKYNNGDYKELYLRYAGIAIIEALQQNVCLNKEDVCMQICRGVSYLHTNNLCHRDLKLENICIDNEGSVRLVDFGMCCDATYSIKRMCGSENYVAPEVYMGVYYDGKKADSWSVGVCFFAIYFVALPYHHPCPEKCKRFKLLKGAQSSANTSRGTVSFILSTYNVKMERAPPEMEEVMDALLCIDTEKRLYVSDIDASSYPHS